ncbi:MAG: peptidoglycan DD-metalloendopeptidase family protein [Anaerolineae bacterium]|nr:peptidoglycan DD-metalloendopeptidase family protein [Anaerolineae bacterium]
MQRSPSGFSTFLLLIVAMGAFGAVLWLNSNQAESAQAILPADVPPTENPNVVAQLLSDNFGDDSTPLPTIEIADVQPTRASVIQPSGATATPVSAVDVEGVAVAAVPVGVTPTLPPPTADVPVQDVQRDSQPWSPPALLPPLSRDPQGRDHYWFRRALASNANNTALFYYSYGSDGQANSERIHHGIDIPNPNGEEVYATASGTVVFASDGRLGEIDIFQNSATYGNVVLVKHDFGYQGRAIYTLYGHLQASLVTEGDYVEAGQPIALVGDTGRVSGPHVHVEIRIAPEGTSEIPRYGDTYNPILWIVPFVGHGVVAGRVMDSNGNYLDDAIVTLRNRVTGLLHPATASTYVFDGTVNEVNSDPIWRENFAIPDVPVGRYDVIVSIDGRRVIRQVDVLEGMTNFVELRPPEPEPTATEDETSEDDSEF